MRKYTKTLSLVVAALMIAALFCGCSGKSEITETPAGAGNTTASKPGTEVKETESLAGAGNKTASEPKSEAEKIEALAGTWIATISETESVAQTLLENIDLYPEEIACVDLTTFKSVKILKFTTDQTYQYAWDPDGTRACAREFYEGVFNSLYENRASLGQLYEVDFDSLSKEEFLQFYADLYVADDFPALLDKLADNCFDYEALAEPDEEGTFAIDGNFIDMTILGESKVESVEYTLGGGVLMLTYVNTVEVYSRVR